MTRISQQLRVKQRVSLTKSHRSNKTTTTSLNLSTMVREFTDLVVLPAEYVQLIRVRSKDGNFRFDLQPESDISELLNKVSNNDLGNYQT